MEKKKEKKFLKKKSVRKNKKPVGLEHIAELKKEARQRTITLITAAFGFVAGLAWNEAIKSLIDTAFPLSKDTVFAKFIYALLVTLVIVVVSYYLSRLSEDKK